jgi:hypothetical protein
MRALRAFTITASMIAALSSVRAQGMPPDTSTDYLISITQKWGASSPVGALPMQPMNADDVELRVWGGYGLGPTFGVILRRTDRRWQAWRARVVRCVFNASTLPNDPGSAPTDSLLLAEARRRCPRFADGAGTFYGVDTLALVAADARNSGRIWEELVGAGVFELPPRAPHNRMMVDGFTIVIEVRRADSYRASMFPAIRPPEGGADSVARQVYRSVMNEFGEFRGKSP